MSGDKVDKLVELFVKGLKESEFIATLGVSQNTLEVNINAVLARLSVIESLLSQGKSAPATTASEKRAPRTTKSVGEKTTTTTTTAPKKMSIVTWASFYNNEKKDGLVGALDKFKTDAIKDKIANTKVLENEAEGSEKRLTSEGRIIYLGSTAEAKTEIKKLKEEWDNEEKLKSASEPLDTE